jgi:hypothetical protein
MKINEDLLPINQDFTSDSTKTIPSVKAVNDLFKYSTEETKTNKVWIDGKPIYKIVVVKTVSSEATEIYISMPSNIDMLTTYDVYGKYSDGASIYNLNPHVGFSWANGAKVNSNMVFLDNASWAAGKMVMAGQDSFAGTIYCILEYTKTTD